jgi:hypothetical protein
MRERRGHGEKGEEGRNGGTEEKRGGSENVRE